MVGVSRNFYSCCFGSNNLLSKYFILFFKIYLFFFLMSHSYLYINALYSICSATIACLFLQIHSVQSFHRPCPWHSNWPCYILWLSWCCSFSVLFVNLDSLSSFYYLGYCHRSHSYDSFLLLIFCLACYNICTWYFLFHLCAGSQILVGRPLKCLSFFGFDFWKLLTGKCCLLNCMAALSTIRSTWTMCTIRSTWMGYTF